MSNNSTGIYEIIKMSNNSTENTKYINLTEYNSSKYILFFVISILTAFFAYTICSIFRKKNNKKKSKKESSYPDNFYDNYGKVKNDNINNCSAVNINNSNISNDINSHIDSKNKNIIEEKYSPQSKKKKDKKK